MKIVNIKYILSISFIIIIVILYFTFMYTETQDEVPERAILVLESEIGGIFGGEG